MFNFFLDVWVGSSICQTCKTPQSPLTCWLLLPTYPRQTLRYHWIACLYHFHIQLNSMHLNSSCSFFVFSIFFLPLALPFQYSWIPKLSKLGGKCGAGAVCQHYYQGFNEEERSINWALKYQSKLCREDVYRQFWRTCWTQGKQRSCRLCKKRGREAPACTWDDTGDSTIWKMWYREKVNPTCEKSGVMEHTYA